MLKETKVVHCRRAPYTEYIGRPSILGNPFSHKDGTLAQYRVDSAAAAVAAYKEYARDRARNDPEFMKALLSCYGETLGCWCKIKGHEPCHGDAIVELLEEFLAPR